MEGSALATEAWDTQGKVSVFATKAAKVVVQEHTRQKQCLTLTTSRSLSWEGF